MPARTREANRVREKAIATLLESRWWTKGEWFRAADMSQATGLDSNLCACILKDMVAKKDCSSMMSLRGHMLYKRPSTSLMSISWRHDNSIYREIERLDRQDSAGMSETSMS